MNNYNEVKKAINATVILCILLFLSNLLTNVIVNIGHLNQEGKLYTSILSYIAVYLISMTVYKVDIIKMISIRTNILKGIAYTIIAPGYIIIESLCISSWTYKMPQRSIFELVDYIIPTRQEINGIYTITYLFIITVILAPVFEEMFFRGFILESLIEGNIGNWKAIMIASILFGVFHLSISGGVNAMIFGVLIGCIYKKERSITYTILIHSVINLVTLTIMLI